MISSEWPTSRLLVSDSLPEELPQLQRVQASNADALTLDGVTSVDPQELGRWLNEGSLPLGGEKKRYRLQTIRLADTSEPLGYMSLYHGYPDGETLYLASLAIRRDCQKQGYGGEVVEHLPLLQGLKDYPSHRLIVTIRNWDAVRFWVRHGFTQVTQVLGSLNSDDPASAKLELVRNCPCSRDRQT